MSVEQAELVGNNLLDLGVIVSVRGDRKFSVSDQTIYVFRQRQRYLMLCGFHCIILRGCLFCCCSTPSMSASRPGSSQSRAISMSRQSLASAKSGKSEIHRFLIIIVVLYFHQCLALCPTPEMNMPTTRSQPDVHGLHAEYVHCAEL